MSYILDALKKSDKERQREAIPDLQADHSLPPVRRQERKSRSWYLLGAVTLCVFAAVALLGWQLTRAQKPLPKEVAVIPAASPVTAPVQGVAGVQKQQTPVKSVAPAPVIKEQNSEAAKAAARKKSFPEKSPVLMPPQQKPKKTKPVPPLMEELPVVIRAGIPDLTFAGHVYSQVARKRLIIINNRIVREGDRISNSLSLKQIDPDGVVLRYENTVFRVKLF